MATVFFAALVPLALKVGVVAPAGALVSDQVYIKLAAPLSSVPSTPRLVEVPVTGLGEA